MGTVFDKLTKMKVALTLLLVSIAFAEDYYYEYYSLDDGCAGRCCTLQISRPDAESVEKYSGVYKKKGGFKKGMGIQGGLESDWPMGKWPNGGEATCIKWNKKKTVCQKIQYSHQPGVNGIYDQLETDSTEWRDWRQRDNFEWFFSFREDVPGGYEGGFTKRLDQDYFDDYSDDKSGGVLEVHGPTAPLFNVSARNEDWNIW